METYFDIPGMKDLKGPIFEYAAMKEKLERIKKNQGMLKKFIDFQLKIHEDDGKTRDVNYNKWIDLKFSVDECWDDPLTDTENEKGCSWLIISGSDVGTECKRSIDQGKYCSFHQELSKLPSLSEVLKIIVELLDL